MLQEWSSLHLEENIKNGEVFLYTLVHLSSLEILLKQVDMIGLLKTKLAEEGVLDQGQMAKTL